MAIEPLPTKQGLSIELDAETQGYTSRIIEAVGGGISDQAAVKRACRTFAEFLEH
jgi:hypothetical protein